MVSKTGVLIEKKEISQVVTMIQIFIMIHIWWIIRLKESISLCEISHIAIFGKIIEAHDENIAATAGPHWV